MLKNRATQTGMSLIEAMVALVVISVGLLGIAALQIIALQQNSSSQWHSQAVWYSYEITDRILANNAVFNSYDGVDTNNDYSQNCQVNLCSAAQMIVADATDWKDRISSLPAGRGMITSAGVDQLLITVMWDDDGTGATGTDCSGNTDTDLTCYSVTILN
ncbi:MAG: type IV pilus modification protein PilV [Gammaproteobacteria bacterium]|nr:type IV pilus modification protein PilV [Gammaproteobacteria bacterium]